jgi:hypothetical protein
VTLLHRSGAAATARVLLRRPSSTLSSKAISRRHRRQSFASGRPGGTVRTGSRYQNSGAGMCWK